MDIDFGLMLQLFLAEAEENLGDLEEGLLALEARPGDEEAVRAVFRSAHTIKGSAATVGFADIVEYAHAMEEILDQLRRKAMPPSPGLASVLLHAADALRQMVHAKAQLSAADLAALSLAMARAQGFESDAADAGRAAVRTPAQNGAERLRTLRIGLDRLDRLLELTGELIVARGRLETLLAQTGPAAVAALDELHDAERLFTELQDQVLRVRMVPVGPLLRRYSYVVREAAAQQGKHVGFRVEGADVLVDTTVMEGVRGPLTHLIRNAVDHGIELPEVRQARGKDAYGQITLRARGEPRGVVFEVMDDGNGFDLDRVAARARTLGQIADTAQPSEEELQQLVFQPGFSTADTVTERSGRGVGLDVVRRSVEDLHGSVFVTTAPGQGTTIGLRLPLTLAVIDGLVVGVGGETYVIPLDAVAECIDMRQEAARGSHGIVYLGGQPVSYVRLHDVLGVAACEGARESLVVLRHGHRRAAVVVDRLHGQCEAVIRPLGPMLRAARAVSGSSVLGSGRVALVLDVPGLLREATSRAGGGASS
ncbi:MAG TPA: chemotaxis protein CheA [Polyangia bacterium]|jgi:two-component system chemotaxis sensor kinase CheA